MTVLTITYIIGTNNVGADDDEIELIDAYRAEVREVRARLDAVEKSAARDGRTLDAATLAAIREGLYGG